MEHEQEQMEETAENTSAPTDDLPELSLDNIADRIAEELAKVVGIDQELLGKHVEFLGGMKVKEVEKTVKTLKKTLGEQLLPLLETMARHEQKAVAELGINGLGTVQSFKSAQILAEIDEAHPDKKLRKAARKSLYKLKSAGIEIETSHKALLGESKHERYKSLISPIDGSGTQLIMLTQEMLAGDLHFLQVVATQEEGIVECSARRGMSKKMFANLPETFARQMGVEKLMFAETDYDYAMSLILEAEDISEDLPDDYASNKDFFGLSDAEAVENPVYGILDAENLKEQPYFLRTSAELFQDDSFLGWHVPPNEVGEYAQELLDQKDTEIELTPQFQQERKDEVYQKLVDDIFDEETLQRLQRRLEIMAYIFTQQDNMEDAKKALTAAITLVDTPQETLKNHPFLRQLILISLDAAQDVIEQGYDPADVEQGQYFIARNEDGDIAVEFIEQQ